MITGGAGGGSGVGFPVVGAGRVGSWATVGSPGSSDDTLVKVVRGGSAVRAAAAGVKDDWQLTLDRARVAVTLTGTVTPGRAWSMGRLTLALPVASPNAVCTLWVRA
jgi:hypothetical protein